MNKIKYLHRKHRKSYRHWNIKKFHRGKDKPRGAKLFDELPFRDTIRQRSYYSYGMNCDIKPLEKFIESKIGQDWDLVYSEILTKIKNPYYRYYIDGIIDRFYRVVYTKEYLPNRSFWGFSLLLEHPFIDLNNKISIFATEAEAISESKRIIRKLKLIDIFNNIENMEDKQPRVGVAVIVKKDNKILLGLRKSKLGCGTWGAAGGKLDFGEELKDCAIRELKEETNLDVMPENLKLVGVSNAVYDSNTHYITVVYETDVFSNELYIMEPDKFEIWDWFSYQNLPENLFLPLNNFIKKQNYTF